MHTVPSETAIYLAGPRPNGQQSCVANGCAPMGHKTATVGRIAARRFWLIEDQCAQTSLSCSVSFVHLWCCTAHARLLTFSLCFAAAIYVGPWDTHAHTCTHPDAPHFCIAPANETVYVVSKLASYVIVTITPS